MDEYRYECETLEGFLQRVVVLAGKGYEFFIAGEVPERKAPEAIDEKLLRKYDVAYSRKARWARKKRGLANVHYLRHGRVWVMMATAGKHPLFLRDSKERVLALRETPLRVGGYAVTLKRDGSERRGGRFRLRVHVRIEQETYLELRDYFEEIATKRQKEGIASEIWNLPFEPYKPVHRQLRAIVWRVNERRKKAGFEPVPVSCVRIYRTLPKHFEGGGESSSERAA